MGVPIVLTLLASGLVGFIVGRWWAATVPVGGLAVFYVGLNVGWWGYGVGEAWQVAMAYLMGLGIIAAVAGIAARGFDMRRVGLPSRGASAKLRRASIVKSAWTRPARCREREAASARIRSSSH